MDPRCDGRMLPALEALLRLSLSGWRIAGDVRAALDKDFRPIRLRIAPLPLAPP